MMICSYDEVAAVAALLLQAGADANAIGRDGRTALFDAVLSQSLEVCKLLIKHEVNVNRPDEVAAVAAHLAVDWPEGLLLLLENGAKGDLRLESGSTLLYEASVRGQLDVIKTLRAKAGVDITSCSTFWLRYRTSETIVTRTDAPRCTWQTRRPSCKRCWLPARVPSRWTTRATRPCTWPPRRPTRAACVC